MRVGIFPCLGLRKWLKKALFAFWYFVLCGVVYMLKDVKYWIFYKNLWILYNKT